MFIHTVFGSVHFLIFLLYHNILSYFNSRKPKTITHKTVPVLLVLYKYEITKFHFYRLFFQCNLHFLRPQTIRIFYAFITT